MKLHIKLFCTFTILCSILSCSQEKVTAIQPAEASMSTIGTDSIIEWSKAESVSSESLINTEMDSVAIIPLKENEGHMLGQISYISCHDDTLVVADNHQVCLYDAKGKYIIAIGAVGHGPEEYLDFGGVFASHDSIYIKDKGAGQILTYDYCGRNTNKRKFKDGAPQDFFVLKNGSILGAYSGYRQNSLYRLIVFNSNAEILGTAFPYSEPQEYVAGNFFGETQEEALFTYPLCDTIFKVSDTSIVPYICMNIHDSNVVSNFISNTKELTQDKFLEKLYTTDNLNNHLEIYPSNNAYLLYYQNSQGSCFSVVKNNKKQDYICSSVKEEKLYYPFSIISSDSNWVYGYIDPASFTYMDTETKDAWLKFIMKNSVTPLNDSDIENAVPLLIKMHMK